MMPMVQRAFGIIARVFSIARKRCTAIEETPSGFAVTEALFAESEREFAVTKRGTVGRLESYRPFLGIKRDCLVASFGKDRATTVQRVIRIERDDPKATMGTEELEELVFKAFWEFLNVYRGRAAKKMGVPETDLVLAHFEVIRAGVGKYAIINPSSLAGKDFFLELRGTFVPRGLLPTVERLRACAKRLYVVEGNAALATLITEKNAFMVECGRGPAEMFDSSPDECAFTEELDWSLDRMFQGIAAALGTDLEVAENLFSRYTERRVSERVAAFFEKEFKAALVELAEAVAAVQKGRMKRAPVRIAFRFAFPRGTEFPNGERQLSFGALETRRETLGIRAVTDRDAVPVDTRTALLLFYPFSYPTLLPLMQVLARRVKWLIAYTNP